MRTNDGVVVSRAGSHVYRPNRPTTLSDSNSVSVGGHSFTNALEQHTVKWIKSC